MSAPDAPNDDQRPGVFLAVEPTTDGYIETGVSGNRTQYFCHTDPESIELRSPHAYREIDPRTGASLYYVTASCPVPIRAIGTERVLEVSSVRLRPDVSPGMAAFRAKYSPTGHPYLMELEIGLRNEALKELFAEYQDYQSRSGNFVLELHLKEPGFCAGMDGRVLRKLEYDPKRGLSRLLPYWREHVVGQKTEFHSSILMDLITVEWSYEIRAVAVRPLGTTEFKWSLEKSFVAVEGPIEIGAGTIERISSLLSKRAQANLDRASALVKTLRVPLYIIAIATIVIALKLAF